MQLSVLLQLPETESLLNPCNVNYKVFPTSGTQRLQIENNFSNTMSTDFWQLLEVGTNSFRLDVTICYLTILLNTVVIWVSAVFFVLGSWELFRESTIIKWEGLVEGGPRSYDHGVTGIRQLAVGFGLMTLHMFVAMIMTFFSHWKRCSGVRIAWAEGTLLDLSRQFGYLLGYGALAIGALVGVATIPHAGTVLASHPNMNLVDDEHVVDTLQWEGHYNTRMDAEMSVNIMLIGGCICVATVLAQLTLGEGANVFYIFPCARCNYEWTKLADKCDGDAEGPPAVPEGLPYTALCLDEGRKNRCRWLATFAHNIFGALRTHQYVASLLIAVATLLRFYSTVPPDTEIKDWPIYIPWTNGSDASAVYVEYHLHTLHKQHNITYNTTITEWNDAGYYMWTSSILFFTASILTLISTFAYSIGLVMTRASIPANHVIPQSMYVQWCWS